MHKFNRIGVSLDFWIYFLEILLTFGHYEILTGQNEETISILKIAFI